MSMVTTHTHMMYRLVRLLGFFAMVIKCEDAFQCSLPCNSKSDNKGFAHFCNETEKMTLDPTQRCCYNISDQTVLGLDLSNCSLQNVSNVFKDMTSLKLLLLENNPSLHVSLQDFYTLTDLHYLSLPADKKGFTSCPGGYFAWRQTNEKNDSVECKNQTNTCANSANNGTCPSPQSTCIPAGPGLVDCICSPGYHGYKCLRQGAFPVVPFVGGLAGSTVILAAFLWITQRRTVKKHTS